MELISIQGSIPGQIVATLSHRRQVRQVPMMVAAHPAGGWHVLQGDGEAGPRCHAVEAAVLLEASEAFTAPELHTAV